MMQEWALREIAAPYFFERTDNPRQSAAATETLMRFCRTNDCFEPKLFSA